MTHTEIVGLYERLIGESVPVYSAVDAVGDSEHVFVWVPVAAGEGECGVLVSASPVSVIGALLRLHQLNNGARVRMTRYASMSHVVIGGPLVLPPADVDQGDVIHRPGHCTCGGT